mmetsp:Transcript_15429/g.36420  ORF Transcript_15429/g.36420 Transcript_15429/m.36420 type:complete len:119 (+) Transcript_15429:37-393(+)
MNQTATAGFSSLGRTLLESQPKGDRRPRTTPGCWRTQVLGERPDLRESIRSVPGMVAANCLFTEGTSALRKSMLQTNIYDRDLYALQHRRAKDTCPEVIPAGCGRSSHKTWCLRKGVL